MALTDFLGPLQVENLVQEFFLPFILTFVIFWGLLEVLRIFNRRINLVLALGITIAAAYGGLFTILSNFLLQLGAYAGVIAFALIFVVGVVIWAFRSGADIISPGRRSRKIRERIEKLYDKLARTNNPAKRRAIVEEIKKLEVEEKVAIAEERR